MGNWLNRCCWRVVAAENHRMLVMTPALTVSSPPGRGAYVERFLTVCMSVRPIQPLVIRPKELEGRFRPLQEPSGR